MAEEEQNMSEEEQQNMSKEEQDISEEEEQHDMSEEEEDMSEEEEEEMAEEEQQDVAEEEEELDPLAKVQEIITRASQELKSIEVNKDIQLECDVGHLLVTDNNILDEDALKDPTERSSYLQSLARDGIQSLFNKVWNLPTHVDANIVYVTLPKPETIIPREKPVPKPKPLSKWEQFAREKGIRRVKKDKKTWDATLKRWVPRYGLKKVLAEKEKNWVREVPNTSDPYEDQFAKANELKKERIAKNEFQRLRNIAKASKLKVPKVGVTGNEFSSSKDMGMAMHHSRFATASRGKFQPTLPDEKTPKDMGKKRKMELSAGVGGSKEKKRYFEVLDMMQKGQLNLDAAVRKQMRDENVADDLRSFGGKKELRRSKAGGRHRTKSDHRAARLGMGVNQSRRQAKAKLRATSSSSLGLGKSRSTVKEIGNKSGGKKNSKPQNKGKGKGRAGKGKMD